MEDKNLDVLIKENLSAPCVPSKKLNLLILNQAKTISNQKSLDEPDRSVYAAVFFLLVMALIFITAILIFIIPNVLVKMIVLTNLIWGLLVLTGLGIFRKELIYQLKGVSLS